MPRDQVRVAIYVRSRGNTHESRTSAQHQHDQLRAVLNTHDGWRLVRTFTDCGSANAVHRPGLAATLVQARAGCFDLLLVHTPDRLTRDSKTLLKILRELRQAGVAVLLNAQPRTEAVRWPRS